MELESFNYRRTGQITDANFTSTASAVVVAIAVNKELKPRSSLLLRKPLWTIVDRRDRIGGDGVLPLMELEFCRW